MGLGDFLRSRLSREFARLKIGFEVLNVVYGSTYWYPAAEGPQATVGPQVGFQVKEEVRMGLGFDWAAVEWKVVVKRRRIGRNECVEGEKERILWDEGTDLYKRIQRNVGS